MEEGGEPLQALPHLDRGQVGARVVRWGLGWSGGAKECQGGSGDYSIPRNWLTAYFKCFSRKDLRDHTVTIDTIHVTRMYVSSVSSVSYLPCEGS